MEGGEANSRAGCVSASLHRCCEEPGGSRREGEESGDVIALELLQKSGKLLLMALFLWQRLNDRLCLQRYTLSPCVAALVPAFHHASTAP